MKCPCCGCPRASSPTRLALVLRTVVFVAALCLLMIVMAMGLDLLGVGLIGRVVILLPTAVLLSWTVGPWAIWWTRG